MRVKGRYRHRHRSSCVVNWHVDGANESTVYLFTASETSNRMSKMRHHAVISTIAIGSTPFN